MSVLPFYLVDVAMCVLALHAKIWPASTPPPKYTFSPSHTHITHNGT